MSLPLRFVSCLVLGIACLASLAPLAVATETENQLLSVVPAPGKVECDGKYGDWDLSGGILICGDVENMRGKLGVWMHAMYDADNVYLLARWLDETPLNNPGQTIADYGFAGDCLQVRFILAPGTPAERTSHWTCWKGRDEADVLDVQYGKQFNDGGNLKNAKDQGAKQAFAVDADKKGYAQELVIPWKLLTKGESPKPGSTFTMTVEPNFTIGAGGRLTLKDLFKPGVTPDRVFTFMASQIWGPARLEAKGAIAPHPVRLADSREFGVRMEKGLPAVDWAGLVKSPELVGFKPIEFTVPADGYVSLVIRDGEGAVVRNLLSTAFFTKGKHSVKWDGLTTPNWKVPGQTVPAGDYTWSAIFHTGLGLELKGWACNSGLAPWDNGPGTNWGGDHGLPIAAAADAQHVYLGWNGAEAGKALLACDATGKIKWANIGAGIAGVKSVAAAEGVVYVLGGAAGPPSEGAAMYKLNAANGSYIPFKNNEADVTIKNLFGDDKNAPEKATAIAAAGTQIYLSFDKLGKVLVLDGKTGDVLKSIAVASPTSMAAASDKLLYVVRAGTSVVAVNPQTGESKPALADLKAAQAIAVDPQGKLYVGFGDKDNQVRVYQDGKLVKTIGRAGGRLVGKWTPDGMLAINSLAVAADGKLWVAELDNWPKRFSQWDPDNGKLVAEFFGPSSYGALGGAINPRDPNIVVGQGCEWRIDPKTGQSVCLGVIHREGMENSRFAVGPANRVYLATAGNWAFNTGPLRIYERLGDANYKLRTVIYYADADGKEMTPTGHGETGKAKQTMVWADANDDGQRQPNEILAAPGELRFSGWYMNLLPDFSLYTGKSKFPLTGFTARGEPKYDLTKPTTMPATGLGSADGRLVLEPGEYNADRSWFKAYDIASGKQRWQYPDNFVGVHGSHNAVPAENGMIRGSFGPTGCVKLPPPLGNVWVIPTNIGEWHLLSEDGYYVSRLFQGDPLKVQWPEKAVPGAAVNNVPPGMGGEDFGGSVTLGADGKVYIQAGKTAFWDLQVTGLETVEALPGGKVSLDAAEVAQAGKLREEQLQQSVGRRMLAIKKLSPKFTGNFDQDFQGAEKVSFKKQDDAAVTASAAWDDKNLYLAWNVKDKTPWVNAADAADQMYVRGDTVDFQLSGSAAADPKRAEAGEGDLRLSIGNFKDQPTAVLYRMVSKTKKPKVFSSGVIKSYPVDFVDVLSDAKVEVKKQGDGYLVEAAIPLASLGISPSAGTSLRGDFGVTHGDPAGQRTRLRSYWNNQHTGIVDDAVFELKLEPQNWGELSFQP